MPRTKGDARNNTPENAPSTAPNNSEPSPKSTKATPIDSASGTSREANVTRRRVPAESWALTNLAL
jgi:hypothetical protein